MCAIQGASPSDRLCNDVGRGFAEPDVGLLTGLSLLETDGFLVFEVVLVLIFRPTEFIAVLLFTDFALEAEVSDCACAFDVAPADGELVTLGES